MHRVVKSIALASAIIALSLVAAPGIANAADNANVAGTWNLAVEMPNGTGTPSVIFKQDGGNLTGTYKGRRGDSDLKGTISGNDIQWTVTLKTPNGELDIEYSGTVDGDTMKGKVSSPMGEATFTGKRAPADAPATK